jgi:hypothetical protein
MNVRVGPIAAPIIVSVILYVASAHAAPPSAFGPEVEVGTPRGGYVGTMNVAPLNGEVGAPFTVTAEGLPPGEEFELVWRTVDGQWKVTEAEYHGREFVSVAYRMGRVETDREGRLEASFTTPEDFGFIHDIVLQQGERVFTQVAYSIDMSVELSPQSGPVGTPINFEIKGIGYRDLERSWNVLYDNSFTGWASSVTTQGSASFTIPATGHAGEHVIEVLHGQFGFPYRNQEQSPEPDRPRFYKRFTVTPGAAVLPAPVQAQAQTHVRLAPVDGALRSDPPFSGVGEPVVVSAGGLMPGQRYALNWTRVVGNRIDGDGWQESSLPIAEATVDAGGDIAFEFTTPDDLGGYHGLWLDADGEIKRGTHFVKTTALPLDVTSGPVGTEFTVHLKGVGWTETSNIMTVVYDNAYIGYACAFNSQGDVTIYLQATGAPGWHFIDLYPAIYKGPSEIPNNYRMPQLTYAADHPGEDLPAFRFAFEVTPGEADLFSRTAPGE